MQPIILTYRGRLEEEKGRKILLPILKNICTSEQNPPCAIHIYGDGAYKQDIITLAAMFPEKIFYHGRQPWSIIQKRLQHTHYALMPSLCIETFGLTALESLSQGVPVIGFRKGGLEPFILKGLALHTTESREQDVTDILKKHTSNQRDTLSTQSQHIAQQYTASIFIQKITDLNNGQLPRSILMVSDYTNPLGGIETYLTKVHDLLQSLGVTVTIVGGQRKKNATWTTYIQMLGTIRNPFLRKKIKKAIHKNKPDIVRYHSVLRNIGHAGILPNPHGTVRTTYHDLGMMHPFPSRIHDINQIPKGLIGRLQQSPRYIRPLTTMKYLSVIFIRKKLAKHSEFHLVPSPFIEPLITRSEPQKIQEIGHFTQ